MSPSDQSSRQRSSPRGCKPRPLHDYTIAELHDKTVSLQTEGPPGVLSGGTIEC